MITHDIPNEENDPMLNEFKRFLFGNIKSNISKDIGIHIRGGDFLRLKKSLGMSFYDNALNQFKCFEPVTIFTNDKFQAPQPLNGYSITPSTKH